MTPTRSVALIAALTVLGLTVAPLASAAIVSPLTGAQTGQSGQTAQTAQSETATTNASVGTLMQASAADTKNTVETGMFEAAYEAADNESREEIVSERTTTLEEQLARIKSERAELQEQRKTLSNGAYRSRMAAITVEIASLERSIERTERRAAEIGVDESRLADLRESAAAIRQNASAQAGVDIATIARGLSGSDGPPGSGGGPPSDPGDSNSNTRGGSANGNGTSSQGNGSDAQSTGASPADRGPSDDGSTDGSRQRLH